MTTLVRSERLDAAAVALALQPRDGLVAEGPPVPSDPGGRRMTFAAEEGPVEDYTRTVEVGPADADGHHPVTQTVSYRLAIRHWKPAFALPVRAELRRLSPRHGLPWWAPPDRLDARSALVLDLLATTSLVVGYVATLMTQTATFATDDFGASNTAEGVALAVTRTSALIALPLVALADRRGRRRIIVAGLYVAPLVAATGALAPSLVWLSASQTLTRAVALTLGLTLSIMLAEEMPSGTRAYAVSLVSMAGALGVGLCLFALPLADTGESGWRLVYGLALLGIPLARSVGRHLPESRRFGRPHAEAPVAGHGARLGLLAASGLLVSVFGAPASQFMNEFLRDDVGFSGGRIALFSVATNTPGAIGVVVGGRLADLRGRRPIAAIGLAGGTLATVAMFASHGWSLWAWSVVGAVVGAMTVPALGVYGPELFPTSLRGRLNGAITVVSVAGSVVGLVAVGLLSDRWDSFGPVFAVLAIGPLLVAAMVLFLYPETAHRTLEELNPEDAEPTVPPPPPPRVGP